MPNRKGQLVLATLLKCRNSPSPVLEKQPIVSVYFFFYSPPNLSDYKKRYKNLYNEVIYLRGAGKPQHY